jgi:polar amino acid transport system substrate-binding protein
MQLLAGALLVSAFATPVSAQSPAPEDDWAKVKAAGKILVGTAADYPPFEFYASNYQLDGFDIMLMKEIGKKLGVEVEFNDFAFEGVLDALQLKQVDAAIAGISVTDDRREKVDFSNLYYLGKDAVLARTADAENIKAGKDLAGLKIGVQKGSTYQAWAQDNLVDPGLVPQANLVFYANVDAMVKDLRDKKTDAVLMGELPARTYDRRYRDITVATTGVNQQRFAIAARNGSTLVAQFNAALRQVQLDGTFDELVKDYLQVNPSEVKPDNGGAVVNEPPAQGGGTTVAPAPCINGAAFVADLNLDDKNMTAPPVMQLNQKFQKGWRMRNSGTCAWDARFALAFSFGNRPEASMGGTAVAVGKAVQPGETADFYVDLVAPNTYGVFQGFWTMRDVNNVQFGETVWVGIQVPNPNPPPTPTAPPPPPRPQPTPDQNQNMTGPNLRADSQYINVGQCTTIRWDVGNVNGVFFVDGGNVQGVGGSDSRTVCPQQNTTYILRVTRRDNVVQDFPITIFVQPAFGTINFWADSYAISPGQCTTLRWDVQGVQAVFLNEQGVAGQSAQQVCPGSTQTWTLRVVMNDGSQQTRQVTITVGGNPGNPTPIP